MTAFLASECYHEALSSTLNTDRLHDSATSCRSVSRVNIDMFAKKASGTMIRVPVTLNKLPTVLTDKILDTP